MGVAVDHHRYANAPRSRVRRPELHLIRSTIHTSFVCERRGVGGVSILSDVPEHHQGSRVLFVVEVRGTKTARCRAAACAAILTQYARHQQCLRAVFYLYAGARVRFVGIVDRDDDQVRAHFDSIRFDSMRLTLGLCVSRKFFTLLASVILYGHSVSPHQWLGVAMVFAGLGLDLMTSYWERAKSKRTALPVASSADDDSRDDSTKDRNAGVSIKPKTQTSPPVPRKLIDIV